MRKIGRLVFWGGARFLSCAGLALALCLGAVPAVARVCGLSVFSPTEALSEPVSKSLSIRGLDTTDISGDALDVACVIGLGSDTLYADVSVADEVVTRDVTYAYDKTTDEAGVVRLNSRKEVVAKYSGGLALSFYGEDSKTRDADDAPFYTANVCAVCMTVDGRSAGTVADTMIGARACAAGDESASFTVPRLIVRGGKTYRVKGGSTSVSPTLSDGVLYVDYEEVSSAGAAATVTYVDEDDNVIYTDSVGTLSDGQSTTVAVLKTVETSSKVYVPLTRTATVTLTSANPEVTINCVARKDADRATNTVSITYVDTDGRQLMADTQQVTSGGFNYVAPTVFSQARDGAVSRYVLTGATDNRGGSYSAEEAASLAFTYDGASAYTLTYEAEKTRLTYTVNLALVAPGDDGYLTVSVESAKTADFSEGTDAVVELPAAIEKDGHTYNLSGSDQTLTYTWSDFQSGVLTSDTVYYTRSDVEPPSAYDVTVRYVDVASGAEIGSQTLSCTVDGGAIQIAGPESVEANGASYVRLSGQEAAFTHRYYAPYRTYTIYYGQPGGFVEGDTTVTRTVVTDGGVTYYRVNSSTGAVTAATGASDNGAATGGLNASTPYATVVNGDGTGSEQQTDVIAPSGTSASEERIEDAETPLAQSAGNGVSPWAVGIAVAAVAGLAALALLLLNKRRDPQKKEA